MLKKSYTNKHINKSQQKWHIDLNPSCHTTLFALHTQVTRLEGQVSRYKSASENAEKVEDELKAEKRKLQREVAFSSHQKPVHEIEASKNSAEITVCKIFMLETPEQRHPSWNLLINCTWRLSWGNRTGFAISTMRNTFIMNPRLSWRSTPNSSAPPWWLKCPVKCFQNWRSRSEEKRNVFQDVKNQSSCLHLIFKCHNDLDHRWPSQTHCNPLVVPLKTCATSQLAPKLTTDFFWGGASIYLMVFPWWTRLKIENILHSDPGHTDSQLFVPTIGRHCRHCIVYNSGKKKSFGHPWKCSKFQLFAWNIFGLIFKRIGKTRKLNICTSCTLDAFFWGGGLSSSCWNIQFCTGRRSAHAACG